MPEALTKQSIFPGVEEKFQDGFPDGYKPWPDGWSFTNQELQTKLEDGTHTLLTLDLSINDDEYAKSVNKGPVEGLSQRAEENYKCEVGCKHCFECKTDTKNALMTFDEVKKVVTDAKILGLKSVKFLGPGELVHNPKLFEILDYFEQENIKISIFTKGVIFGDDEMAMRIFRITAEDLCKKIASYKCVRLLIGFTSADPATENARLQTRIKDFSAKRNRGIENMARNGLNADPKDQRIGIICAPVLKDNIDEALMIFKWGIMRNLPVVIAPTMISGKGADMPEVNDEDFKKRQLVDLYVEIYSWLIKQGIMTLEDIEKNGISPYPGFACNQFISGMFVRKDGRVQACPGNETAKFRYAGDVRESDLKSIWTNSLGYLLRTEFVKSGSTATTQICYAKTESNLVAKGSISAGFYEAVLEGISHKNLI